MQWFFFTIKASVPGAIIHSAKITTQSSVLNLMGNSNLNQQYFSLKFQTTLRVLNDNDSKSLETPDLQFLEVKLNNKNE